MVTGRARGQGCKGYRTPRARGRGCRAQGRSCDVLSTQHRSKTPVWVCHQNRATPGAPSTKVSCILLHYPLRWGRAKAPQTWPLNLHTPREKYTATNRTPHQPTKYLNLRLEEIDVISCSEQKIQGPTGLTQQCRFYSKT